MKLRIAKNSDIQLLQNEYFEFHDGRNIKPIWLDSSICGIKSKERAEELLELITSCYQFPKYKMEPLQILASEETYEVLFSISDFTPFVIV